MRHELTQEDCLNLIDAMGRFLDADVAGSPLTHATLVVMREAGRRFDIKIQEAIDHRVAEIPDSLPPDVE